MSTVGELSLAMEERDALQALADIRRRQRLVLQDVITEHEKWERIADSQAASVGFRLERIAETQCCVESTARMDHHALLNVIEAKLNEQARQIARLQAELIQARENAAPDHEDE